ncbi:Negative regulatory subunit of protein phosphatase 1, partial [Reticulomyxa filosa]
TVEEEEDTDADNDRDNKKDANKQKSTNKNNDDDDNDDDDDDNDDDDDDDDNENRQTLMPMTSDEEASMFGAILNDVWNNLHNLSKQELIEIILKNEEKGERLEFECKALQEKLDLMINSNADLERE